MAYDEGIANVLRSAVGRLPLSAAEQLSERRMFGGLCVLINGKMLAGVIDSRIVIRLSDEELTAAINRALLNIDQSEDQGFLEAAARDVLSKTEW